VSARQVAGDIANTKPAAHLSSNGFNGTCIESGGKSMTGKRWEGWTVPLLLMCFAIIGGCALLAVQGRWLLVGWASVVALLIANLLGLLLAFRRVSGHIGRLAKNEAVQRELLEGKLWRAAVPLPMLSKTGHRGYLSAIGIVKNEGSYLNEWLEFHRLVGVQHIYLYDNGSTDDTDQVLSELPTKFVTRIPWATFVRDGSPQKLAYAHALSNFGPDWRWMAFIDADEFLFPTNAGDLSSVLMGYEHLPALAVYWRTFGTAGHQTRPSGLVIENFTMRTPFPPEPGVKRELLKFKSIVDPSRVRAIESPHMVTLDIGVTGAYTEEGVLVQSDGDCRGIAPNGHLRLNHYYTKSSEELAQKLSRGSGAGMPADKRKKILTERIALIDTQPIEDRAIQRFVPELRRLTADVTS
jgi:hypothetical protein